MIEARSRLRSGRSDIASLKQSDAELSCRYSTDVAVSRELTGGAFDPWALPGGVDPAGLVKGWAADRDQDMPLLREDHACRNNQRRRRHRSERDP